MIILCPITPATGRDKAAKGVIFNEELSICATRPGASRSRSSKTDSGVISRGENPVPPVRRIREQVEAERIADWIDAFSSGTVFVKVTLWF
jgi:hypothetical protein